MPRKSCDSSTKTSTRGRMLFYPRPHFPPINSGTPCHARWLEQNLVFLRAFFARARLLNPKRRFGFENSPFVFPCLSCGLRIKGQAGCQARERSPHARLVVSNLQPAPRHVPRSRIWFQIRHHQDKSRANGRHWLTVNWAARLTGKCFVTACSNF